jgi:hypothetical protein
MDNPIKNLFIEALKFVGTSSIVATLSYLWIRDMRNRLQKLRSKLTQCQKKRHEEKDEMIEEMERDVALMEKVLNSDDSLS